MNSNNIYTINLEMRWGDMDTLGHANNTPYFAYMEQARIEWLNKNLKNWYSKESSPVVASATCHYIKPMIYPTTMSISTHLSPPGTKSIKILHNITDANKPDVIYAKGEIVVVWINPSTGKTIALPQNIVDIAPNELSE